jgi:hypothetical protein
MAIATKGKQIIPLAVTRSQSAALLRLINRALKDNITMPDGTDRRAIISFKRTLVGARYGEVAS